MQDQPVLQQQPVATPTDPSARKHLFVWVVGIICVVLTLVTCAILLRSQIPFLNTLTFDLTKQRKYLPVSESEKWNAYADPVLGFSLSYPETWSMRIVAPSKLGKDQQSPGYVAFTGYEGSISVSPGTVPTDGSCKFMGGALQMISIGQKSVNFCHYNIGSATIQRWDNFCTDCDAITHNDAVLRINAQTNGNVETDKTTLFQILTTFRVTE